MYVAMLDVLLDVDWQCGLGPRDGAWIVPGGLFARPDRQIPE